MKPFFAEQTKASVESFLMRDQHARTIIATNLSGLPELISEAVKNSRQNFIIVPLYPDGSSITIEQIRNLKQSLALRQVGAQMRLILINQAEKMTHEAQNSFLKLLEEPPEDVRFLLLAQESSSLLTTIISRSPELRVRSIAISAALDHYTKQGVEKADVERMHAVTDGQPGAVYALLSSPDNAYAEAIEQAKQLLKMTVSERLLLVDQLSKDKEQQLIVLSALHDVLRAVSRSAARNRQPATVQLAKKRKMLIDAKTSLAKHTNSKLLLTDVFLNL